MVSSNHFPADTQCYQLLPSIYPYLLSSSPQVRCLGSFMQAGPRVEIGNRYKIILLRKGFILEQDGHRTVSAACPLVGMFSSVRMRHGRSKGRTLIRRQSLGYGTFTGQTQRREAYKIRSDRFRQPYPMSRPDLKTAIISPITRIQCTRDAPTLGFFMMEIPLKMLKIVIANGNEKHAISSRAKDMRCGISR